MARSSARARAKNGAVGCVVLLVAVAACFSLFDNDDSEPAPVVRPAAAPIPTAEVEDEATVELEPEATETDEPTVVPTDEPTELPPTAVPPTLAPTAIPEPTQPPPLPTEPPDPRPDLNAGSDLNCSDFSDGWEAQRYWDYWRARGVNNPGGLDGDGDGDVCESRK